MPLYLIHDEEHVPARDASRRFPLPSLAGVVTSRHSLLPARTSSTLVEYLGSFSGPQSRSQWIIPSFSAVVAGMYWSRTTNLDGYSKWSLNSSVFTYPNPYATRRSEVYYPVDDDRVLWERPSMNATNTLYLVFALQPCLTILVFVIDILMYNIAIGRGFGPIALLAGVRTEGLRLLQGASFSGKLTKPLRVSISVLSPRPAGDDRLLNSDKGDKYPTIAYTLGVTGSKNESLSHHRHRHGRHDDNEVARPLDPSSAMNAPEVQRGLGTGHYGRSTIIPFGRAAKYDEYEMIGG